MEKTGVGSYFVEVSHRPSSVDGGLQNDSFEGVCPEDVQKDFGQSRRIVSLETVGKDVSWRISSARKSNSRNSDQKYSWNGRVQESSGIASWRILWTKIERKSWYDVGAHFTSAGVVQDKELICGRKLSHVRSQSAVVSSPRTMSSRDQSLRPDTWNFLGISVKRFWQFTCSNQFVNDSSSKVCKSATSRKKNLRGRSPSGKFDRQPCEDYLKGICTKSPCDCWHPPECQFYKSESGRTFGDKCSYAHRQVEGQSSQNTRKDGDKSAVATLKEAPQFGAFFRTQSRRNLCGFYGRAQKSWEQFDEYDSQKLLSVLQTSEKTKVRRSEKSKSKFFISVVPTLWSLRIGLRRRSKDRSDVFRSLFFHQWHLQKTTFHLLLFLTANMQCAFYRREVPSMNDFVAVSHRTIRRVRPRRNWTRDHFARISLEVKVCKGMFWANSDYSHASLNQSGKSIRSINQSSNERMDRSIP